MENCKAKLSGTGLKLEGDGKIPDVASKQIVQVVRDTHPSNDGRGENVTFGVSKLNLAGSKK